MYCTTLFAFSSVEADPKTERRCGNRADVPDKKGCTEKLKGQNKAIVSSGESTSYFRIAFLYYYYISI